MTLGRGICGGGICYLLEILRNLFEMANVREGNIQIFIS